LYPRLAVITTTLILLDINVVIAVMFGLLAARSSLSRAERKAAQVQQQPLDPARGASHLLLVPVGNILLRHGHSNSRSLVRR
jgi:hypothetical protein